MPILYKNDQRVLFAHIPKCAGSSIAAWFQANGWIVSNLFFGEDDVGAYFKSKGIHRLQIEGVQAKGVSPQHAHATTTSRWGPYSSSFAIVRDPLARFVSQLKYAAHRRLGSGGSTADRDDFAHRYFAEVKRKISKSPWLEDNHFRPQHEFLLNEMRVLRIERDEWQSSLSSSFGLEGKPPRLLGSAATTKWTPPLDTAMIEWVCEYYAEDYVRLGYQRGETVPNT